MRWFIWLLLIAPMTYGADLLPDERRSIARDPIYGQALYSLHSGEYDKALGLNYQLRKSGRKGYGKVLDIHAATAQLGLGMSQHAQKQYNKLLTDSRVSFLPAPARAQAWFYMSKHFYNKGLWASALSAIRKVKGTYLAPDLKDEYHFLSTTLELFKGQPEKADQHILAINPDSKWAVYAYMNLAVSYTERDIHISKVEAIFNKALLLAENADKPEALADKINLMAGQFFYATGRGRSAIKHLKSVSLDGAYTPKALLTYGWALTEQWQYHDALQPWYMLKTTHSPLNQDVQETLIAIPHLLEKLNAKVMALGAFDYATEQFDDIYRQLGESAKRLNSGEFIEPLMKQQVPDRWGAFESVDLSLPNHPDQVYLKEVMSQGYFQGELTNLRDLHVMRYQLQSAMEQLTALDATADARKAEYLIVKKEAQVSKQKAHLEGLQKRYKKLLSRINKAFKDPDGSGLASQSEKDQLASFTQVTQYINRVGARFPQNEQSYKDRLRRVEGVLKWTLSERYSERKRQVSQNLALLEEKIIQTKKQFDATQYAFQVAPKSFDGFKQKINKLNKTYQMQLTKLDKVYYQQREKVGSIVKIDIKKRQERVMDYQMQARLAAARLFDETSNKQRIVTGEVRQ
ncbi:MAG: hypothetical protein ACI8SR_001918 [Oceanicoccus sp.]|jgi:hypothetical protein